MMKVILLTHDKYLELVALTDRLVDVLRTTLELKADLFRRTIQGICFHEQKYL